MTMRKWLLKLAQRIERAWQHVDWSNPPIRLDAGWYVTEFVLEGALRCTPRLLVKKDDGKTAERELIGAHSGRNRMLVYLPSGRFHAYSEAIQFQTLARVPAWEGRARVLLICWRYLLDFFSPWTLVRMVGMQFKPPFALSTALLEFYSPPEATILASLEWWQRRPWLAKVTAWWLRDIKIGVLIEDESQRERLINMLLPPDGIALKSDAELNSSVGYYLPLAPTETLRSPAILMFKIAIWRAQRKGLQPLALYSDHDYAANNSSPQHPQPVFKPNPSLAYLHCFNFIGPSAVFSQQLIESIRPAALLDENRQYQLLLQACATPAKVVHVPELLLSSLRTEPLTTPSPISPQSAWSDIAWLRDGQHNKLAASAAWDEQPSVDIIIPTRDGLQFLEPCVTGILEKTDYQNFQIFIVDNGSEKQETKQWLAQISNHPQVTVIDFPGEFNFSAINNTAVAQGSGDYVALVNNDIEVIHADWLQQMMVWAKQANVGIVGAKLLFGNGLVQHAGVTIGMGNAAGHLHRLEAGDAPGYQNRCIATQNMMAVTAACFVTPRALYEELGGLNETEFRVAYNDIDYCLRVEQLGMDVIWTPQARLYHLESVSRGDDMSAQHIERYFNELTALQKRWKTKGFVDKYYNKHLRISDEGVYPQIDVAGHDILRQL